MAILPAYLELVQLLSSPSSYSQVLSVLSPSTLTLLLPYLPLPVLLKLPEELLGSTSLSELIDFQRDWVGSEECPKEMRDSYLVRLFEGGGKGGLDGVKGAERLGGKEGIEYVFKAEEGKGGKVCESLKEFEEGLKEMSNGLFENLDWSNVCLGGGSVLALLEGKHNDSEFAESDFDLFLYGLKPDELIPKVASIISQIKSVLPDPPTLEDPEDYAFEWSSQHKGECLYILGFNAMTIIPPRSKNRRPIQIILHTNETVFDTIAGFDLDCCCFAYTGKDVVAVPRALRAYKTKTNLLDERLARKIDPTASTLSSRALKYLDRGYSFGLSPSSSSHLASLSISLSSRISSLTTLVSSTSHRVETLTDTLKGLDLLIRKKWNRDNKEEGEDGFKSDYGPVRNSAMKVVDGKMLRGWENGEIAHDYWENQVKVFQDVIDFISTDKKIVPSKKVSSLNVSTYLIPYVCGFDHEYLLGLKDKVDDKFPQTWSSIRNLQYIVRLPKSVIPLIEKGENDFNETIKTTREKKTLSNSKKSNTSSITHYSPNFTSSESNSLCTDLDKVKALSLPLDLTEDSCDLYPPKSTALKPVIPAFSGSYKPHKTNTSSSPLKFLQPLTSRSSQEIGTTSTSTPYVYRSFTLSSLLQFRNLSPSLDQAKDLLYLLYSSLVRRAVSEPQGMPSILFPHRDFTDNSPITEEDVIEAMTSSMNSKKAKDSLMQYLAQPTKKQVEAKFEDELKWIEKLGKKLGEKKDKGEKRKLGELDEDRKRWLEQWVKGEIMV